MKYGAEGYGIYFMVLERLRDEANYMSIKDYNVLAFDLRVDTSMLKAVVEEFGLFVFTADGKYFYSEGFNKRMAIKDEKSSKRSAAGKKGANNRWGKQKDGKAMAMPSSENSKAMAMPSKKDGKETKVNKSKVNKNKVNKNKEDKDTSRKSSKRTYDKSDVCYQLALKLWEQVKANNEDAKEPRMQSWANDMRLMQEQDKRSVQKIENMIAWSQKDDFWSTVVLSPKKLRKNYDQMAAKANIDFKNSKNKTESLPDWARDDYKPKNDGSQMVSAAEMAELDRQLAEMEARNKQKEG